MGKDSGLADSLRNAEEAAKRNERSFSRMSLVLKEAAASARQLAKDMAALAGPAVLHATFVAAKGGAAIQSQNVQNAIAGIQPQEREQAAAQAAQLAGQFPLVNTAEVIQLYRELRSVLKDTGEVSRMLPTIVQAKSILDASDPSGKASEGLLFSMRSAELFGLASDPAKFRAYIDSFLKATQVEGRTINSEGLFEFAQMAKSSAATLSPQFVNAIAPLLVQEMGGGRAGTSTDQFIKQVVGGFQGQLHAAAKEFVAIGLARQSDFETTRTGEIKGLRSGHHVAGYELAASDPSKWVWDVLIPALKAKGFDTEEKQLNEVRRLFPNGNAANIVSKFIQQQEQWQAKAERISQASGLDAVDLQRQDPIAAIKAVTSAFDNLLATLASPGMKNAAEALSSFADTMARASASLAAWQKANPRAAEALGDAALGAGAIGGGIATYATLSKVWQAMTGNGAELKASALALDGAAAALERAAASLAAGGKVANVEAPKGGSGVPGGPEKPGGGLGWGRLLTSALSTVGLAYEVANAPAVGSKEWAANVNATNGFWDDLAGKLLPKGWVGSSPKAYAFGEGPPEPKATDLNPLGLSRYEFDDMRGGLDREAQRAFALSSLPAPDLSNPGLSLAAKLDALTQPQRVQVDPVTGTVSGEAQLHITVDASGMRELDLPLNLRGDLGQSHTVPSPANGRAAGPL